MSTPFELLLDLDQRARANSDGLPAQQDLKQYWSGVGFSLAGERCVAPLSEVAEILHMPDSITMVPGVKSWIKGVANSRGRLLPVMDLGEFLGLEPSSASTTRRILVLEQGDLICGLIVDGVQGMQHFEADTFSDCIPASTSEALQPLLAGSYQREASYLVFSLFTLAEHASFMQVALETA